MQDEIIGKALPSDSTIIPRYKLTAADGTIVADNVQLTLTNPIISQGTPISKATMLSDSTAAMYGLPPTGTVNDALAAMGSRSQSPPGLSSDLWLYLSGNHPFLNNTFYSREFYGKLNRPARAIDLTGNAQSIQVYDSFYTT